MALKTQIQDDMKTAMRAKDSERLSTIRMLLAAIKQFEIDKQQASDDTIVLSIINKMIKQRRDAAKQFQDAKRDELADKELREIEFLKVYLPEALTSAEIEAAISKAIDTNNANSIKDMGKVMGILQQELAGRADMGQVSKLVKQQLSN